MTAFIIGVLVGFLLFAIIASVIIINRIQTNVAQLTKETDNLNKALQLVFLKVNKIEKTTDATMQAAESFVDALRDSAENMQLMSRRPNRPYPPLPPNSFDDIRKSFEDGIKDMEDGIDEDSEEESDGPPEPWK